MDNPEQHGTQSAVILIGVAIALSALVAAGATWATLGYWLAWKLQMSLGMILPPFVAGCIGGLIMRFSRKGFQHRTGWVAVAAVLIGCAIGDLIWIKLASGKPLNVLLGTELKNTIDTMTNLSKLMMFAVACYLAYAISNPPKVFTPD